jgi:hypothetical protein
MGESVFENCRGFSEGIVPSAQKLSQITKGIAISAAAFPREANEAAVSRPPRKNNLAGQCNRSKST